MIKKKPKRMATSAVKAACNCGCGSVMSAVKQIPEEGVHDTENLDQYEMAAYNLIKSKGIDGVLNYLVPTLIEASKEQLSDEIARNKYWSEIMEPNIWINTVLEFMNKALPEYLELLRATLFKTSADMEQAGKNPMDDERLRMIAITECTTARAAASVILITVNNAMVEEINAQRST